jgi:cytochrome c oxidase subunit 2
MTGSARSLAAVIPALTAGACSRWESVIDPSGVQAQRIALLFWLFTAVCTIVWLLTMVALGTAMWRGRHTRAYIDPCMHDRPAERRASIAVSIATAATVVILVLLTSASYLTTNGIANTSGEALTIRVTGRQWWWDIRYEDAQPDRIFTTANEIHVPIGRLVKLKLVGADVIHSFWVPSLAGKQDLIPGRDNDLELIVQRQGVYRGLCAEFCGLQHAHMGIVVKSDFPETFLAWQTAQLRPAAIPTDETARRGLELFESKPCAACHTIRGTKSGGRSGPDLTHVAGRSHIAAGTLPTTRGSLAAFIADPQQIKPGSHMPRVPLSPDDLNALAAYLSELQ